MHPNKKAKQSRQKETEAKQSYNNEAANETNEMKWKKQNGNGNGKRAK